MRRLSERISPPVPAAQDTAARVVGDGDRGDAYAEGAQVGAPRAVQVADRWHILKNLGEVLIRVFDRHREQFKVLLQPPAAEPIVDRSLPVVSRHAQEQQRRRAQREARYAQIRALYQRGVSVHAIARELQLDRRTVRKYGRAPTYPEPQPRARRRSVLDPYKAQLLAQWNAGCHVGTVLLADIRAQGYSGGRSIVMDFVAQQCAAYRGRASG